MIGDADLQVYVFAEDVAASGGYLLACAGDEIICDASSIVGSTIRVPVNGGAGRSSRRQTMGVRFSAARRYGRRGLRSASAWRRD